MKFAKAVEKDGRVSEYAIVSDCGRYSVAKTHHSERVIYAAWLRGQPPTHLADFDNAADAKARCALHLSESAEQKTPPKVSREKSAASVRYTTKAAA